MDTSTARPTFHLDKHEFTRREVIALATIAREHGDKAAAAARRAAQVRGDIEDIHFHTGRQAAFLTMYHEIMRTEPKD